nr:MAG TPA: hypothetical protein [Caudoviricetes sp.]
MGLAKPILLAGLVLSSRSTDVSKKLSWLYHKWKIQKIKNRVQAQLITY